MVVAVATYASEGVAYSATCTFQVSLPVTVVGTNPSNLDFAERSAQYDVTQVGSGDIFSGPAKAEGIDPGSLAQHFSVNHVAGTTFFTITVTDSDGGRAASLSNRMCEEFVQRITAQHTADRDAEISQLQAQIADLKQAVDSAQAPSSSPAPAGSQSLVNAQKKAILDDEQQLAQTLSLLPDHVAVVTRVTRGVRSDSRSLSKNLIVGAVAALLTCFLIILVGEMAREARLTLRRSSGAGGPGRS